MSQNCPDCTPVNLPAVAEQKIKQQTQPIRQQRRSGKYFSIPDSWRKVEEKKCVVEEQPAHQ